MVGFEPTPPETLVPYTSALDRSATLPLCASTELVENTISIIRFTRLYPASSVGRA